MRGGSDFGAAAILGMRDRQEDHYDFRRFLSDGQNGTELVAVLADGMGGHAGGEVASNEAVVSFLAEVELGARGGRINFREALDAANDRLRECVSVSPSLHGMGCTIIGVALNQFGLRWISVGDSLLLCYRRGAIHRLNADHSMAAVYNLAAERGLLSAEDAANHPERNLLRSAVMGGPIEKIDWHDDELPLESGDIILLASDGLATLSTDDIGAIVAANADLCAEDIARALTAAVDARRERGQDNTTVLVLKHGDQPRRRGWADTFSGRGTVSNRRRHAGYSHTARSVSLGGMAALLLLGAIIGMLALTVFLNLMEKYDRASELPGSHNSFSWIRDDVAWIRDGVAWIADSLQSSFSPTPKAPDAKSNQASTESKQTKNADGAETPTGVEGIAADQRPRVTLEQMQPSNQHNADDKISVPEYWISSKIYHECKINENNMFPVLKSKIQSLQVKLNRNDCYSGNEFIQSGVLDEKTAGAITKCSELFKKHSNSKPELCEMSVDDLTAALEGK